MGISPAQPCSQITIRFVICLPVKQNLNDLNCPISAPSNDWIGFGLMQISGGRRSVPEVGRKSVPEVGRSSVSEVGRLSKVGRCQRSVGARCQRSVGVRGRSVSKVGRRQRSVGVRARSVRSVSVASEIGRCPASVSASVEGRCQVGQQGADLVLESAYSKSLWPSPALAPARPPTLSPVPIPQPIRSGGDARRGRRPPERAVIRAR